jgi:DivIVA domain-containing protein
MCGAAPPVSAHEVRECVFRTVRLSLGYNEPEVDRFLAQLTSALEALGTP